MGRYILLQKNRAKAPLLGTKSKPYKVRIDKDISFNWYLMDEAWLVTSVYLNHKDLIAGSLRDTHPDIGPNEIDKFMEIVKTDHPLEHIDFKWNDIPLYATAKSYCELTLPWLYKVSIKLTQEQEKELLGIIQDDYVNKKSRMINWFCRYRCDYGIDARLKRDRETQDEDLAEMFCMVHGFDLWEVNNIRHNRHNRNNEKRNNVKTTIATFFIFFLILMGIIMLFIFGIKSDSIIVFLLCSIPFGLLVTWINNLIKGK